MVQSPLKISNGTKQLAVGVYTKDPGVSIYTYY